MTHRIMQNTGNISVKNNNRRNTPSSLKFVDLKYDLNCFSIDFNNVFKQTDFRSNFFFTILLIFKPLKRRGQFYLNPLHSLVNLYPKVELLFSVWLCQVIVQLKLIFFLIDFERHHCWAFQLCQRRRRRKQSLVK